MTRTPPRSTLFPFTPLFRSHTSELQSHDNLYAVFCLSCDWSSDVCRSEEHTSELQSHDKLVSRLLLEKNDRADDPAEARRARRIARLLAHNPAPGAPPDASPRRRSPGKEPSKVVRKSGLFF